MQRWEYRTLTVRIAPGPGKLPGFFTRAQAIRTLVGELELLAGERVAHPDLKLGYFAQHTVESLHEGQTPLWHLRDLRH